MSKIHKFVKRVKGNPSLLKSNLTYFTDYTSLPLLSEFRDNVEM